MVSLVTPASTVSGGFEPSYLRDQQLYVLFEAVQDSLQRAGVGGAALPSPDLRQPTMFVPDLG